jgi:hypothetical protein
MAMPRGRSRVHARHGPAAAPLYAGVGELPFALDTPSSNELQSTRTPQSVVPFQDRCASLGCSGLFWGRGMGVEQKTSFGSISSSGAPRVIFLQERASAHAATPAISTARLRRAVTTEVATTAQYFPVPGGCEVRLLLNAAAEPPHRCEHAQALHTCCCLLFLGALPSKPTCPKSLQGAKRLRCGPLKR